MIICNQVEDKIKMQYVFGELQGIKVPKSWRNDVKKHIEAVNFMNLYQDWSYYNYTKDKKEELKEYGIKYFISSNYINFEYSTAFYKCYPQLFKDIDTIKSLNSEYKHIINANDEQ